MEKDQNKDLGLFLLTSSVITGTGFLASRALRGKTMVTRKQEEYQSKVIKTRLYRSGQSFTLSDIVGILDVSAAYARQILTDLVSDGFLSQIESDTCISYSSVSPIRRLLSWRLANYDPPIPAGDAHKNPWIRASLRQEYPRVAR